MSCGDISAEFNGQYSAWVAFASEGPPSDCVTSSNGDVAITLDNGRRNGSFPTVEFFRLPVTTVTPQLLAGSTAGCNAGATLTLAGDDTCYVKYTYAGYLGQTVTAMFTAQSSGNFLTATNIIFSGGGFDAVAPQITGNPQDATVGNGRTATFVASASGNPTPTVQWQVGAGSDFENIPNANSTTLSFSVAPGDNGKRYRAVFSNGVGTPATTTAATLTTFEPPVITSASHTTFAFGVADAFTITTSGSRAIVLSITPDPPGGLTFRDNGDGTATLFGTPSVDGVFPLTITAINGAAPDAVQSLTLKVLDTTKPSVTISGAPGSATSRAPIPLTFTFSEPVTGFDAADIAVTNAIVTSVTPAGGNVYTVTIKPTGPGTVTVELPAETVMDSGSNGNTASNLVSIAVTVSDETAKTIGGFVSERGGQIVSNQPDLAGDGIDKLNAARGQNGGASSGFSDEQLASAPSSGFGLGGKQMANGGGVMIAPTTAMASNAGGTQDLWGLQAMLYGAIQNAGQSGAMDRFSYTGAFDATVNAHDGFAASFHTSLSQIHKWQEKQDTALGIGNSKGGYHSPFDVWVEGTYAGYGGERSGQFGLFSVGSDYVLNPNILVGVFAQVDTMKQTSGAAVSGTGWMAGPYATLRVTDQLFWNAKAAWGRSGNTLSGSGDFGSTRWLAATELAGKWKLGQGITFAPNLGFTYFTDATDAYTDTFGTAIPGVRTELGQFKLSPQLSYGLTTDGGLWVEPSIVPELIWNFASTHFDGLGALSDTATGPTGLRGRVKAGLTFRTEQGVSISATGSYDGIGSAGYNAIAAQARVNVQLN